MKWWLTGLTLWIKAWNTVCHVIRILLLDAGLWVRSLKSDDCRWAIESRSAMEAFETRIDGLKWARHQLIQIAMQILKPWPCEPGNRDAYVEALIEALLSESQGPTRNTSGLWSHFVPTKFSSTKNKELAWSASIHPLSSSDYRFSHPNDIGKHVRSDTSEAVLWEIKPSKGLKSNNVEAEWGSWALKLSDQALLAEGWNPGSVGSSLCDSNKTHPCFISVASPSISCGETDTRMHGYDAGCLGWNEECVYSSRFRHRNRMIENLVHAAKLSSYVLFWSFIRTGEMLLQPLL